MAKSKLKAALEAHKGIDHEKLKEKKKAKEADKRKRVKAAAAKVDKSGSDEEDDQEEMSEDEEEGGVLIDEEAVGTEISKSEEKKLQAELKALLGNKKKLMEIDSGSEVDEDEDEDEDEWESAAEEMDEDEEEEGSSDEDEDTNGIDISRLVDSESDSDSEDDDDDEEKATNGKATLNGTKKVSNASNEEDESDADEEEEDGEGIPLSDLESLASEDKGDIIPYQRLTINNKAALEKALTRIALDISKVPFSTHQTVTSQTNTANGIEDIDDDLKRELAFYAQSLGAVKSAREQLKKEGVPFSRPVDYFAEMVKSDEHMGKVKEKLRDEAARKKASAEARRQRDLKKFGKAVQVAKMQERAKEKRETLDRINTLKRKRAGEMPSAENEPDLFDVSLEDAATTAKNERAERKKRGTDAASRRRSEGGAPDSKRAKKDSKFGFGGKKRFNKSGDAQSSADMRGYSAKNMKKPFGAGKSRPGKSKRAKGRL